ncbi:glycine betaine ABC transporter substrate-binding protein [Mycobacterium sp. NPDC006124]|uniref:glycine betaine ABC transporter substrate-binding protein n=1 Tax=Mycobacterium sp. NPDC006124 TaxID=3156729 RepID=UPI0033BEB312
MARVAALLAVLVVAACGNSTPATSLAVGTGPDAVTTLLAHLYAAALRSYGSAAHVEQGPDPLAELDTGDVEVAPGFTGRLLVRFDPDATARAPEQVYRSMISALPEGIGAGDYAQSAQDKPALAVTEATARTWGGRDVAAVARRCPGLTVGKVAGAPAPTAVATCRLPAAVEFPTAAALVAALRSGRVVAAWTSTAVPQTPDDVVVLSDETSAIRAENVVPLYRRNELDERQVLALNEIAGELDTGSLADMLGKVAKGAEPGAVAEDWLSAHPLGH